MLSLPAFHTLRYITHRGGAFLSLKDLAPLFVPCFFLSLKDLKALLFVFFVSCYGEREKHDCEGPAGVQTVHKVQTDYFFKYVLRGTFSLLNTLNNTIALILLTKKI